MSIISASKVGGGLAKISSKGGLKFNIVIYIFCTAFYSIDSHCIQVKLKNRPFSHCLCACVYRSRGALFLDNRRDFTEMGQTDFKPLILSM